MIYLSFVYIVSKQVDGETHTVDKSNHIQLRSREANNHNVESVQRSAEKASRHARLQDKMPNYTPLRTSNSNQHLSNYEHGIYSSLMKILNNVKNQFDRDNSPRTRTAEAEVQFEPALINAATNLESFDYIRNDPKAQSARQVHVDSILDTNNSRHTDDRILDLIARSNPTSTTSAPSMDQIERLIPLSTVMPSTPVRSSAYRPVYSQQVYEDVEELVGATHPTAKSKSDGQTRFYDNDDELGGKSKQSLRARAIAYTPKASNNYEVIAVPRLTSETNKKSRYLAQIRSTGGKQTKPTSLRAAAFSNASDYTDSDDTSTDSSTDDDNKERPNRTGISSSYDYNSVQDYMPSRSTDRVYQAHPNGVVLQQVYPTRTEDNQNRFAPAQTNKNYLTPGDTLQSFANNRIGMTLHSTAGSQTSLSPLENSLSQSVSQTSQSQPQRDLLHQPQTIQITAVPNMNTWGQNNAIVRLNGYQLNGLAPLVGGINPGWPQFIDPYGRQVLAVGNGLQQAQADRRQIDWSFWIWPILAVVSLPLILGALFVPVFLKTVVILIQLLQSLGLLIPITTALSNQLANAAANQSTEAQGTKGS